MASRPGTSGRRLILLILGVLSEGPLHGYGVVQRIEERSGGLLTPGEGLLYPLLHELEGTGLLSSTWEEVAGRRRKIYALTRSGERRFADEFARWQAETKAVRQIVDPKEDARLALG